MQPPQRIWSGPPSSVEIEVDEAIVHEKAAIFIRNRVYSERALHTEVGIAGLRERVFLSCEQRLKRAAYSLCRDELPSRFDATSEGDEIDATKADNAAYKGELEDIGTYREKRRPSGAGGDLPDPEDEANYR